MYGEAPKVVGTYPLENLNEYMHYLYLPIKMGIRGRLRVPANLKNFEPMFAWCVNFGPRMYEYAYVTARKGYATPDNPLNRPGWHCDGFGTDDYNFIWWKGAGTRFAVQPFAHIDNDHVASLKQFDFQVEPNAICAYREGTVLGLSPYVVHATPLIRAPGEIRQFIKVSLSDHQYNLKDNSHNYLFDYKWEMKDRNLMRNDPHRAQLDYMEDTNEANS